MTVQPKEIFLIKTILLPKLIEKTPITMYNSIKKKHLINASHLSIHSSAQIKLIIIIENIMYKIIF